MRSLVLATLMIPATALAVPMQLEHQGRLFDSVGTPVDGTVTVDFKLFDSPAAGTELFAESQSLEFDRGYFDTTLGAGSTPLDDTVFSGDDAWLELTVDSGTPMPRVRVVSVPYAIRASVATDVSGGGIVDAAEIRVGGTTVIDNTGAIDWSAVSNKPASLDDDVDNDTLGDLSSLCSADELAVFDGTSWGCGTFDHTHDLADLTGTLPATSLPADLGTIVLSDDGRSCDGAAEGAMRWGGGLLQVCDGTNWQTVYGSADGASQASAGVSCATILANHPGSADGAYWIDPNGAPTTDAFQVDCDMAGGGWIVLTTDKGADNYYGAGENDPVVKCSADGVTSYTSGAYAVDLQYTAPGQETVVDVTYFSAGNELTSDNLDGIRSIMSLLHPTSQLWGGNCDSDDRDPGHQARAVARDGSELLLTPVPSGNNLWASALFSDTTEARASHLLPHGFRVGHYAGGAQGGGAFGGWTGPEIRVR